MSDAVLIALIGAVPTTITAVAALVEALARSRNAQVREGLRDRARQDDVPVERLGAPPPRSPNRLRLIVVAGVVATVATVLAAYLIVPGGDGGKVVRVLGTQTWTDTGIELQKGDEVEIAAKGEVFHAKELGRKTGPGGIPGTARRFETSIVRDSNHNSLIARIGNRPPFEVGSNHSFETPEGGRLHLGINDSDVKNNDGMYTAQVRVDRQT